MQYCRQENLIEKDDVVLAGVSGGADSVCLLLMLKALREKLKFDLAVVHVEHGIRGKESEEDALFVEKLCNAQSIPYMLYRVDARRVAKEQKLSVEEAARSLRYECYKKAAVKLQECHTGQIKIALAHHADDNAETVLFQMVRGSGMDGLCGMWPKRSLEPGMTVIRPMLHFTRSEIEAYLVEHGQTYRIDSTNADETYSRNKIRGSVLPQLTKVNAQAVAHINQSAAYLRELSKFMKQQVACYEKEVLIETEQGILLKKEPFEKLPLIMKTELTHLALTRAAGVAKDLGSEHVRLIIELFSLQVGRMLSLPYQVIAKRVYEGVLLTKALSEKKEASFSYEVLEEYLSPGKAYEVCVPGGTLVLTLMDVEAIKGVNLKKKYTKYLDYDKMRGSLWIRTRQSGDYFILDKAGHKKSMKEYFIQEKIPAEQRNQILLLAKDKEVFFIAGGRISADVKISEQTENVIKVQIKGENYNED